MKRFASTAPYLLVALAHLAVYVRWVIVHGDTATVRDAFEVETLLALALCCSIGMVWIVGRWAEKWQKVKDPANPIYPMLPRISIKQSLEELACDWDSCVCAPHARHDPECTTCALVAERRRCAAELRLVLRRMVIPQDE